MSRKKISTNESPAAAPATDQQAGAQKDPLKRDLFWFFAIMFLILAAFFGLFLFDKQANILAEWSRNIDLSIIGQQEEGSVTPDEGNIQVDISDEESVSTENSTPIEGTDTAAAEGEAAAEPTDTVTESPPSGE